MHCWMDTACAYKYHNMPTHSTSRTGCEYPPFFVVTATCSCQRKREEGHFL